MVRSLLPCLVRFLCGDGGGMALCGRRRCWEARGRGRCRVGARSSFFLGSASGAEICGAMCVDWRGEEGPPGAVSSCARDTVGSSLRWSQERCKAVVPSSFFPPSSHAHPSSIPLKDTLLSGCTLRACPFFHLSSSSSKYSDFLFFRLSRIPNAESVKRPISALQIRPFPWTVGVSYHDRRGRCGGGGVGGGGCRVQVHACRWPGTGGARRNEWVLHLSWMCRSRVSVRRGRSGADARCGYLGTPCAWMCSGECGGTDMHWRLPSPHSRGRK
jgi:hypothetical protein